MFCGRFIAVLGDLKPMIFDTILKVWISCDLAPGSHPLVPREYPGAFQLPYAYHKDRSAKIKLHLEFVMFSGMKEPFPHL